MRALGALRCAFGWHGLLSSLSPGRLRLFGCPCRIEQVESVLCVCAHVRVRAMQAVIYFALHCFGFSAFCLRGCQAPWLCTMALLLEMSSGLVLYISACCRRLYAYARLSGRNRYAYLFIL